MKKINLNWLMIPFFAAVICLSAVPAQAHCGKCGMGEKHADKNAAGSSSGAGMVERLDKKQADITMLAQSAEALKESNPELSAQLSAYADSEQQELDEKIKWIAAHKEEMKKYEAEMDSPYEGSHH